MSTTPPTFTVPGDPEPVGGFDRPLNPLVMILGSVARERELGNNFTCAPDEAIEAPGVWAALDRLGYRVCRHNPWTWLIEFPTRPTP